MLGIGHSDSPLAVLDSTVWIRLCQPGLQWLFSRANTSQTNVTIATIVDIGSQINRNADLNHNGPLPFPLSQCDILPSKGEAPLGESLCYTTEVGMARSPLGHPWRPEKLCCFLPSVVLLGPQEIELKDQLKGMMHRG